MSESYIGAIVRKMNLNLLLLSLAGLAVVVVGAALNLRYLSNLIQGPAEITRPELFTVANADEVDRYYITITGDDTADTGFSYVSTSDSGSETTDAYYLALWLDERLLLVESTTPEIEVTVSGALKNIPDDIQTEVIDVLEMEVPEITDMFLPVMVNNANFAQSGAVGLAVGGIVALLALFGIGLAGFRLSRPEAHPAVKALSRFGEPETVMREIDMEMAMNPENIGGKTSFTSHWLVSAKNGLQALPYRDAMWGYKQVTQHRTNGIPTGKTYAATIYDRHGKQISVPGKETEVDEILQGLARHTPGVVIGYSDEINTLWTKERSRFIDLVDQRRSGGTQ